MSPPTPGWRCHRPGARELVDVREVMGITRSYRELSRRPTAAGLFEAALIAWKAEPTGPVVS